VGKPLRWLAGEVKTPPMSEVARREMGFLLRKLREGEKLSLPHSRPMPAIGNGCHELRVIDKNKTWRLFYFLDAEAIVILEVGAKKTQKTLREIIDLCQKRLKSYEKAKEQKSKNDRPRS
jgi:phage-related protein